MIPLSPGQRRQLDQFADLACDLNRKLNLYSPASAADFERRHITHALTLASRPFPGGSTVVDWGTGGGVPGLPLAILFPETEFVLVDAVDKKVRAVQTMIRRLGLSNVEAWSGRAERWEGRLTHSVSRATSSLAELWSWHTRVATPPQTPDGGSWAPGLICLKGGDLTAETTELTERYPETDVRVKPVSDLISDSYFESKYIVEVIGQTR